MGTLSKELLSQSTYGKAVSITSTLLSSANCFHVAPSASTWGQPHIMDEVWVYASNIGVDDASVTLLFGVSAEMSGLSAGHVASDAMVVTIPYQSGRVLIIDGRLLQGGLSAFAYASTESIVNLDGFVNRITN